jgi:hypothetical protein
VVLAFRVRVLFVSVVGAGGTSRFGFHVCGSWLLIYVICNLDVCGFINLKLSFIPTV